MILFDKSIVLNDNIIMKTCFKCNQKLPLTEQFFGIRKDSPDGFRNDCNACVKKRRDKWHQDNRDSQLVKMKQYNSENREDLLEKKREYNKINRDIMVIKCYDYYQENKDKVLLQMKEHRIEHREEINEHRRKRYWDNYDEVTIRRAEYRDDNIDKIRAMVNKYYVNKRKNDINYRILCNIRSRIWLALKSLGKSNRTINLIGCSVLELKIHLEKLFLPGMTWENYGLKGWHVDHIIPCAIFDLTNPEHQKICFHYTNLQPLWWLDNLRKGAKIVKPFQFPLSLAF
jgi:hypothetical protein